jgi:nitric oxide dioxygenase
VLKMVAGKHASLGIRAEHYPIVGKHLLASICEVLDQDPNSDFITAWGVAYWQVADFLIQMEFEHYYF